MALTLADWLAAQAPTEIAAILACRPDVTLRPVPRHRRELADRLEIFNSVAAATHHLPMPALQVIEVLQLLGTAGGDRADLAGWLGRSPDDPDLQAVLELLAGYALVWPDGGRLRMVAPLYHAFPQPLRLGQPARPLLTKCPADELRAITRTLGLPARSRKDALVEGIATALAEPERIRKLVASAPAAARAAVEKLAVEGAPAGSFNSWYAHYQRPLDPSLHWGRERGLVLLAASGQPEVPQEVAVALRGPDWHAPFTPRHPAPALTSVDPAAVRREAAATGSAAVDQVTALLETVASTAVTALKAGGVGVKEIRRLAKALGASEPIARLWLELAHEAELLAPARHNENVLLLPSPAFDDWGAAEPADRLADLLLAWTELTAYPALAPPPADEKPPAALVLDHSGQLLAVARARLLALLASLPEGQAVAPARTGLVEAMSWHAPLTLGSLPDRGRLVTAAWQEAELVGVIAHGALTPLGRALAAGRDSLATTCRELLPPAVGEAIFQADLTALVPGTPAAPLAALLDSAADRETRSAGAATWRFNAGSIRRALDAGQPPGDLLAALGERAAGGVLPQPLRYLISDVARRHGAVRARAVACVLRSEDTALLAEIAKVRTLAPLGLAMIAPTVLGSATPLAETLAALRQAGYAPVAEAADGSTQLERRASRRAGLARRGPTRGSPATLELGPDLAALAEQILAGPVPTSPPARPAPPSDRIELANGELAYPPDGDPLQLLAGDPAMTSDEPDLDALLDTLARHLSAGERRLLAHAIEQSEPVKIAYRNAQGNLSQRTIEPLELEGEHLVAWCQLRDDERYFLLHRITSVAPAPPA